MPSLLDRIKRRDPYAIEREKFDVTRGTQKRLFQDRPKALQRDPQRKEQLIAQRPVQRVKEVAQRGVEQIKGLPESDVVREGLTKLRRVREVVNENIEEGLSRMFEGNFPVSQTFGTKNTLYSGLTKDSRHLGLDVAIPEGTPLRVPVSGKISVGYDPKGFGLNVVILGDNGTEYRFSHLSKLSPAIIDAIRQGRRIGAGTIFALSGGVQGRPGAGNTTGAHLDVTTKRGGEFVNPEKLASIRRAIL
jgi:murein DD-endopeptidase MepM/ murein hydrolase activator NlpD